MKYGIRKPSLRKSISARTTGRAKRACEKSINSRIWKERNRNTQEPLEKRCITKFIIKQPFQFLTYSNNYCPTFGAFYLAAKANVYSRKENWSCISKKEMGNSDIFKIIKTR